MKKIYINPEVKVVELKFRTTLLAGSLRTTGAADLDWRDDEAEEAD